MLVEIKAWKRFLLLPSGQQRRLTSWIFLTVRRLITVDRYKLRNPVYFSWKTRYLFNLKKIKFNLQRSCIYFYTSYTNHVRCATDDVRIRVWGNRRTRKKPTCPTCCMTTWPSHKQTCLIWYIFYHLRRWFIMYSICFSCMQQQF